MSLPIGTFAFGVNRVSVSTNSALFFCKNCIENYQKTLVFLEIWLKQSQEKAKEWEMF